MFHCMKYAVLIKSITGATIQLQENVAAVANQGLVIRNWLVGAWLVEFEQNGRDRAKYGQKLLETVAADLAKKEIKGLTDPRVLRDCRMIYRTYPQIRGSVTRELGTITLPPNSPETLAVTGKRIRGSAPRELPTPLTLQDLMRLSWTHLQELTRLDDPWQRAFYENECIKGRWSIRQLQRQIGSLLYERTGLSSDKNAVIQRARTQEPQQSISDVLRDPYILEFTGLAERSEYSELNLETVLLDHLQKFLLELGRGFCFEARQFRITEGRKHHRIDLVFYHRLLRCHVLIDLKIRPFKPSDAGQMNFYVNWFKAHMMEEGDRPPVGILLCSDSDGTEVEFATAGMDQKLFVSRYLVALPSVEKLRRFLEADRERIERLMPPPVIRIRAPRKPKD
jgi:predicted nuclease of restriction endonuclease-like (RecB) superfamily